MPSPEGTEGTPGAASLAGSWVVPETDQGTILVPVDFSDTSKAAASWACELARVSSFGVRLIHALEPGRDASDLEVGAPPSIEVARRDFQEYDALGLELSRRVTPMSLCFEEREPVGMIEEYASAEDVGMIVLGAHRAGIQRRLFLGSVAQRTIRSMQVPVLTVKEQGPASASRIRRIVLATDFSPDSEHALRSAVDWARRLETDIHVFHALSGVRHGEQNSEVSARRTQALDALRSILERLRAEGVVASAELSHGPASVEIERYARRSGAGLLILGHRGRRSSGTGICGSVAERVLRQVKCSVLMVPGVAESAG